MKPKLYGARERCQRLEKGTHGARRKKDAHCTDQVPETVCVKDMGVGRGEPKSPPFPSLQQSNRG